MDIECARTKFGVSNLVKSIQYKMEFNADHPNYMHACGLTCFIGPQGSGKTLSAVQYVLKLMQAYPKCKLVTNLDIKDYPIVTYDQWLHSFSEVVSDRYSRADIDYMEHFYLYDMYKRLNRVFPFVDNDDLINFENGYEGVIYLVDEIQLYMGNLEKNNINPDILTELTQQRKQRKHIVCTTQMFSRLNKAVRQVFDSVVICECYFGFVQNNSLIKREQSEQDKDMMEVTGKVQQRFVFCHSPAMYRQYDTYKKIKRAKFVAGEKRSGDIYDQSTNGV